jgi:peptidylprolyl isomerase
VKQQMNKMAWLLAAAMLLLFVVACGPATPTPPEEPETEISDSETPIEAEPESETESETSDLFDAELPTAEPIVLEGAEVTESGLQYLEKVAGDGASPQEGDIVTMHFTGTLADGTLFGDSYSSDQPVVVVYGRGQLLPGWEEGVGMMKAGGEAQMVIPPELGFADQPAGAIPPNSQLIFDIELLSVESPPDPAAVDEDDLETTDSGLMFYDIVEGDGDTPEDGGTVTTDFTIWVREEDGDRFVVSSADNEPISFTIGRLDAVFPGWDEGVSSMKKGGKRYLVIPSDLALGPQGGGDIPPDSTLVMEVELLEVVAPPEPIEMEEVDPDDYIETESGLMYYDVVEGDGASPEEGQTVIVHYTGWLEDGTQFDSSVDRGEPFPFPIGTGSVIVGWDEGVATMKIGGKRQLRIPSDLAYGDGGSGPIPPGATLIFDVELLDIVE